MLGFFSCHLRHVIGRISSGTLWINTAHLAFVVVDELDCRTLQVVKAGRFGERRHVVVNVLFCSLMREKTHFSEMSVKQRKCVIEKGIIDSGSMGT